MLKDGQVVEQGTHEELLMNEGGLYKSMWVQQSSFGGEELVTGESTAVVGEGGSEEERQAVKELEIVDDEKVKA